MQNFSDIIFMILGIALLVITLIGVADIGIWGYLGSIACIGYGLVTMYKMRLSRKALKSELLQDQRVVDFYKKTLEVWSSGQLASLNKNLWKEGRMPYDKFVKRYRPVKGSGLFVFFSNFAPRQGEYLVGIGDSDSSRNSGWFVLTNLRLIQRDGRDGSFKEVTLADIETFEMKGKWTAKMMFKMKSGQTIEFEKVEICPVESFLNEMIRQAKRA